MLSRNLIDLINSGDAIAIVGSGISTEAGLPSWGDLFLTIADEFDRRRVDTAPARALAAKNKFPKAFDRLADATSRRDVHAELSKFIDRITIPGKHHKRIADWPFRYYVTPNYDRLIERAAPGGLVAVGNRGAELHKVSAGCQDIVWHIHGASGLSEDISQFVITDSDYADFYPNSNVVQTLQAVSRLHRCVFVGFGFKDEDLIRVLEAVGRLSHSGRPSFAFIGYEGDTEGNKKHQEEIRSSYNIEVIPYSTRGSDHSELHCLLDGYAPFIVRKSVSLGRRPSGTPAYEPLAASLRVQASLDLGELSASQPGLHLTLIGVRLLSHIRENPGVVEVDLLKTFHYGDLSETAIHESILTLRDRGLITAGPTVDLTPRYHEKVSVAQANLELNRDRFIGSLQESAVQFAPTLDEQARDRIVETVSMFLEELCRERGLGVAQNLATSDVVQTSARTVSLLQHFPERLYRCRTRDEAIVAVGLTSDILTRPKPAEAAFLGLLCQCYFGQHLIGATDRLANVDLNLITGTCYLLDASVLICLLPEGGNIHEFTSKLVRDLAARGATLVTTDLFVDEITEHANWALRLVTGCGENSREVLDALRGVRGYRSNQFLQGYYFGETRDVTFTSYIGRVLAPIVAGSVSAEDVTRSLKTFGIQVLPFNGWVGFEPSLFAEREGLQREIADRRMGKGTYTHPRQTKAEAEVALIVDGVRTRKLQPPGFSATDAFFLSSTRVVDDLPNLQRRISLRPEGLAQWLWSSEATSQRHSELVFEQLLWELASSGVEFVDKKTLLRKFSGVIEAAKEELESATRDRREYLIQKYGANPAAEFSETDPLDYPRFATEVQREALDKMERTLAETKKREQAAQAAAKITGKELGELARLRSEKLARRRKAESKKRASESRKGKKKGRKKK